MEISIEGGEGQTLVCRNNDNGDGKLHTTIKRILKIDFNDNQN